MSAAAARPTAWRRFLCRACGYVYDEALGDPDSGLAPGTRFDDIPDDWECPLCGVTKADFEPIEPAPAANAVASITRPPLVGRSASRHAPDIVIVGGGRAGWQLAQALRERDAALPITLVSACAADAYDKPQLSIACGQRIPLERLRRETGAQQAERLRVRLMAHTDAIGVDARARRLRTTRGTLRYRALVLAHGAEPRVSALLPGNLCWRINHLDAYLGLRAALDALPAQAPRRVAIVGAGLVGCELANDLASVGVLVTLIDVAERPLAALLDAERSAALLAAWQPLPLRFVGGAVLADVRCGQITLADGRSFDVDQIIAATGLVTRDRLARSAGIGWDQGIAVDPATMRSSDAHIYALGDCASIGGQTQRFIEPIGRQARTLAAALLGAEPEPFQTSAVPIRIKTRSLPMTV